MKIAILTGGGDCPGLNTVIRAIVKASTLRGWESFGILGGFEGLLDPMKMRLLDHRAMDALLYRGGTVLGTSNRGRFSAKTGQGDMRRIPEDILHEVKRNLAANRISALVCIGGDGSLTIAQQLYEIGVPIVGVPKTIDNDLAASIMTFGFETAVSCAVDALDRLRSTAESHNRVMVLEVMGRYAGWIAGYAGLAGGADVILIPEIEFDYDAVCRKIKQREAKNKHYTLVVVAEGAVAQGGSFKTTAEIGGDREARLGGIGQIVADKIEQRTGKESRSVVLQEAILFTDTVMNNLKYAREGATDEECIEAAKEANAHEFIMNLPNGYDTMLTERGANLSQGQRQMITISRAMVAQPKLMILDKATSNVDTRTEKLIQEGLRKLMEGKTSFSIAHRLATIRDSAKIMVLNGGEIVEYAPHDELMADKGFYHALYMSQFKGKAPGGE